MFDQEQLARLLAPGLTVQEAIDLLISDGKEIGNQDIHIAPPEPNIQTDEDSGDEEIISMDNLSRRQLQAEAELRSNHDFIISGELPSIITNEARDENSERLELLQPRPPDSNSQPQKYRTSTATHKRNKKNSKSGVKSRRVTKHKIKSSRKKISKSTDWITGDLEPIPRIFPCADYAFIDELTPIDMFERFIDEEVINLVTNETNRYAKQNNFGYMTFTCDEIRCFIAILYLTSYHNLPCKRLYWEKADDTFVPLVSVAMRLKRFEQILRCFHVVNNEVFQPGITDKLWKIRPLIDVMKRKFSKNFLPERNLSYDESMVRYFGKCHLKQFIPTKPIRFGYKVWSLNTSNGYLVDFEVYQGKSGSDLAQYEKKMGKSAAPLLKMIDNFPPDIKAFPFHFYIDNLFTTFQLLSYLRKLGYGATGTLRENRIPKSCPLPSNKSLKKKPRGHIEQILHKPCGISICKWVDNSVVAASSNTYGINPISKVPRYSFQEKKQILVPRPAIFTEYNKGMGGTDRMDQNVNLYRIQIRNRKWYWPLITWLLNVSLQNAWVIFKRKHSMSQLDFRRAIVTTYLKKYKTPSKGPGRPSSKPLDESRYDRIDHLIQKIPDGKRRRCAGETCISTSRYFCSKCDKGLCVDCFAPFHTR